MTRHYGNGWASTITTGPTAGATSVTPTSVTGAPATPFDARIRSAVATTDGLHWTLEEIVSVTDITSGVCTISRASEAIWDGSQSAVNFSDGAAVIEQVFTAGAVGSLGGGAGALVLLEQHTAASSASLDFTTFISSTYDTYLIEVVDLAPASNGVDIGIEIGTGGGPTWDTGDNYAWGSAGTNNNGTSNNDSGNTGLCRLFKALANDATYGFGAASLTATNLQSTSHRKSIQGTVQFASSTGPAEVYNVFGMNWTTNDTAVTGLRFIASAGDIASGTVRVYGIAKS